MRKIKIPRIIKINWIKDLSISVVFNNGESRIIDFRELFKNLNINNNNPVYKLLNNEELSKVKLIGSTLSWDNTEQYVSSKEGTKIRVPFEIGADVLFQYSIPEKKEPEIKIGKLIRDARIEIGMSQEELAIVSGTSRTYISRIENDKSDIELNTLRKIIETGLGKHLSITIV
jgi:DNA-binding XRE family transcriptional regulator